MSDDVDIYGDNFGSSTPQRDSKTEGSNDGDFLYDDIKHEEREERSPKRGRKRDETPERSPSHAPRSHESMYAEHGEDVDMTTVIAQNMTWWTTDKNIEDLFSQFGRIKSLKFLEDKVNGKSKGIALIEYYNKDAGMNAMNKAQGRELQGRPLALSFATPAILKDLQKVNQTAKPQKGRGMGMQKPGKNQPIPSYGGGGMPLEMMMGMPPFRGGGRGGPFQMMVPDPRMLGIAPHVNPNFFRKDEWDKDKDRERSRSRSRSPRDRRDERDRDRDDRYRKRERDDRHHRDDYDRDDRKRHKDHRSSRH